MILLTYPDNLLKKHPKTLLNYKQFNKHQIGKKQKTPRLFQSELIRLCGFIVF